MATPGSFRYFKVVCELPPHGFPDKKLDLGGHVEGHDPIDELAALLHRNGPDDLLDARDHQRVHAQLVETETEQDHGVDGLARHLPAHGNLDAGLVPRIHHLADELEHSRVQRFVEVTDPLVYPVDGQGVLDEVVGADAEEVHLFGKILGDECCRGNLHHDPDLDVLAVGDAVAP